MMVTFYFGVNDHFSVEKTKDMNLCIFPLLKRIYIKYIINSIIMYNAQKITIV